MNLTEILLIVLICLIIIIYKIQYKNNNFLLNQKSKEILDKEKITKKKSIFEKQKENKLISQCSIIKIFEILPGDTKMYNTSEITEIINMKENLFLYTRTSLGWELISVKHLSKNKRQYYFKRLFYPDNRL